MKIYNYFMLFYNYFDMGALMFDDDFKKRYGKIPFAVYHAKHALGESGDETRTHWHREIELIAVLSGAVRFFINGKAYDLFCGDVLTIPPCAIHRAVVLDNWEFSYLCICFDPVLLYDAALKDGLESGALAVHHHVKADGAEAAILFSSVKSAFDAHECAADGWELEAIGYLSIYFSRLLKNGYVSQRAETDKHGQFCRAVSSYIAEHYKDAITSHRMAEAMYLSESYFCRQFRHHFGETFSVYLTTYRVEKAKALLRNSAASIAEIVREVGFSDFSYFSMIFKKQCGLTPSAYRKRCGNIIDNPMENVL